MATAPDEGRGSSRDRDPGHTRVGGRARDPYGIADLLADQRHRVRAFTARQEADGATDPPAGAAEPEKAAAPDLPGTQQLLDAMPVAAMLLVPVFPADGETGGVGGIGGAGDYLYVAQNAAARQYAETHMPGVLPPWRGPLPLFRRFPHLADTVVPALLAEAYRTGREQGPEPAEWYVQAPQGEPVRISNEVRAARCGEHLLLTWEQGHRVRMAREAQRLARVCWAEWSLGDGRVDASLGLHLVLGLDPGQKPPSLPELARMATPDSRAAFHELLDAVLRQQRTGECDLRIGHEQGERVIRFVAEPVRLPHGPVWSVRAVLRDVTEVGRSRELAERAQAEARTQRERADAVADIAGRLREAVLPRLSAELALYGLESAAVYRPDAGEAGVGGDWYKTRVLPNGRVLVALGDARGHGLDAVALMAKLRYALAGLAYTGTAVEQLTAWLNEAACDDGSESTTTAVIARYHPESSLLRWTCAGHPCPVLVRDGSARLLRPPLHGPGLPLGVLPDATYEAAETQLRRGDVLLLYSDGLIERRDCDLGEGFAALLAAAERCAGHALGPGPDGLQSYADALVKSLTQHHQTDDATVLAFRRTR